jgi:hypothetical protein
LGLYNAVVEAMDTGIGRVLDALDAEGIRGNTVVIFISDNGASRREGGSNLPLRAGKDTVFEGGIRTPAIISWPGKVAAGSVLAQPISVQDLYATITAIAGTTPPSTARLDGVNQWPAILGNKLIPREPFIVASYDIALIDGDWKLIELQAGERLLYNLKDDLSEATNLAKSKPDILARLGAKLDILKKDLPAAPVRTVGPGTGGSSGAGAGPARALKSASHSRLTFLLSIFVETGRFLKNLWRAVFLRLCTRVSANEAKLIFYSVCAKSYPTSGLFCIPLTLAPASDGVSWKQTSSYCMHRVA